MLSQLAMVVCPKERQSFRGQVENRSLSPKPAAFYPSLLPAIIPSLEKVIEKSCNQNVNRLQWKLGYSFAGTGGSPQRRDLYADRVNHKLILGTIIDARP